MGRADVYLQPQAADPVLADDVVLGMAGRYGSARVVTDVDESGGEARVYIVDDTVVVKTQRPHRLRPRTSLAKEAYLLDVLGSRLGGRIPRLLGYDQMDTNQGTVEYVCMTRIPGRAVRGLTVAAPARREVLGEVAWVLRTLHETPVDMDRLPTDADAAAVRRRLEFGFGDIVDAFAEREKPTPPLPSPVDNIVEQALAAVPDTLAQPPVVLHSNPSPTHVYADPATGQFTGVIDFGDSYASHQALDLHRWVDPADRLVLRDAYLDGAAPNPEFDRMWTIAMIYADLAAIAADSPYASDAAQDLAIRLDHL